MISVSNPTSESLSTSAASAPSASGPAAPVVKQISAVAKKRYEATRNAKVVIVDDEELNILVVKQHLASAGYHNVAATSDPSAAIELIREEKPDVILLDIHMPRVSGLDLLHVLSLSDVVTRVPILILTASTDAAVRRVCLELGVADFLNKPIDPLDLVPRVRNALENKFNRDRLTNQSELLQAEVKRRTLELEQSRMEVVYCLARAAEFRDDDTGQHVVRVGRYVGVIAKELGFNDEQVEMLELAAQLHDVGKIAIPDAILHKPGKLDPQEFDMMRRHCSFAKQIIAPTEDRDMAALRSHTRLGSSLLNVSTSPLLLLASRIAQTHHERWDGTGYPLRLKGEDIPLEGRMTAVADVFDALSSRRPYKDPFPRERCFEIIAEGRGTQFDPRVVDAFFARTDEIIRVQLNHMDPETQA